MGIQSRDGLGKLAPVWRVSRLHDSKVMGKGILSSEHLPIWNRLNPLCKNVLQGTHSAITVFSIFVQYTTFVPPWQWWAAKRHVPKFLKVHALTNFTRDKCVFTFHNRSAMAQHRCLCTLFTFSDLISDAKMWRNYWHIFVQYFKVSYPIASFLIL